MHKIRASVGKHGINNRSDVRVVQTLLNRHIIPPYRVLKIDGLVGSKTITAILAFQYKLNSVKCDGLVSPGGRTFNALRSLPKSVPVTELSFATFDNLKTKLNLSFTAIASRIGPHIKSAASFMNDEESRHTNRLPVQVVPTSPPDSIAWGAKVTPQFKSRVIEICTELETSPDYLMACMAFETCETFRTDILNISGSKAIGLIQFMPATARGLGTSSQDLANMEPVEQLDYVRKFLIGRKGKLHSLEDLYMAIIYPKAIGKDPDTPIFIKGDGTLSYQQNKSLDRNKDNQITPRECTAAVRATYQKGLRKGYFG